MKNKNIEKWIIRIVRLKINLGFILIFCVGLIYVAENYLQEQGLKTICFGVTLLLIIMFNLFNPMRNMLDIIEEIIVERRDKIKRRRE